MPKGQYKALTQKDYQYIKDNYLKLPIKRIAKHLGISNGRINRFLKRENLTIPDHIIERNKKSSQFNKNHIPFNKGMKIEEFMSQDSIKKSKDHRFKKGQKPHNTKYNGAIVERKDKSGRIYKYIRIAKNNWKLYHRFIWEQNNGKIPEDHLISFKDGNSLNCDINNLKLITKTENMLRNSYINYPEEIIPSMVLIKKLENKLEKQQDNG